MKLPSPLRPSYAGATCRFQGLSSPTKRIPSRTNANGSSTTILGARRPLLSEDDLATPPDPKVIEAVETLNSNNVLASGTLSFILKCCSTVNDLSYRERLLFTN